MGLNRQMFFDIIRKEIFYGKLAQGQVDGISAILNKWDESGFKDLRWLAYMLATAYHETAKTMQPIEEFGRGAGKDYGKMLKMGRGPGKRIRYSTPKKYYYGRGHVQLTWYDNYERMGKLLGVDLLNKPELALDMNVSAAIMFEGMTTSRSFAGDFTGHHLGMYFNAVKEDWLGGRKIINGKDQDLRIANIAKGFYSIIRRSTN